MKMRGKLSPPLLPECEAETHDLYQAQLDCLQLESISKAQLDCLQLESISKAQPDRIIKRSLIALVVRRGLTPP